MRVSMQCGRTGSAVHNERNYQMTKEDRDRAQGNLVLINPEMSKLSTDRLSMKDYEVLWYETRYAPALDERNKKYIREGHRDRVKTIQDMYTSNRYRPEEMILQIGNASEKVDPEVFKSCVKDYMKLLSEWNKNHGRHMVFLDVSIHVDETTPHAHLRRVWEYTDKDGLLQIGMNQALKQAGIDLPEPSAKEGRYNNRKMSFDSMCRELWQTVVKDHGLDIITEPRREARKHLSVKEYKEARIDSIDKKLGRARDFLDGIIAAQNQAAVKADFETLGIIGDIADTLSDMFGLDGHEKDKSKSISR